MEYIQQLINLGYTVNQSQLYLSGLSLGQAPASRYASHTGINRATAYQELLTMENLGIMKKLKYQGVRVFESISPRILLGSHTNSLNAFQNIIPNLETLSHTFPSSKIHSYKGIQGLQKACSTIISMGIDSDPLLCLVGTQNIHPDFKKFLESDERVRIRTSCNTQSHCIINPSMHCYNKYVRKHLLYKVTHSTYFSFPGEIVTIGDHSVGFLLYGTSDLEAIIIQQSSLNTMMKGIFLTLRDHL